MNDYILGIDIPHSKITDSEFNTKTVSDLTGAPGFKTLYVEYCDPNDLSSTLFNFDRARAQKFFTVAKAKMLCNKLNNSEDLHDWKSYRGVTSNLCVKPIPAHYVVGNHIKI